MDTWEYREVVIEYAGQAKVGRESKMVYVVKLIEWLDSEKGTASTVLTQPALEEGAHASARTIMARLGKAGWELAFAFSRDNYIFKRRGQQA